MNLRPDRLAFHLLVTVFICVTAYGAGATPSRDRANEIDALTSRLLERFSEADKKGVVVMDLQPAFGQPGPFGSWFADQVSSALTRQEQKVEVIDRRRLPAVIASQHLSPNDESDVKTAVAIGKEIGATTVVVGSYGAAENGIGITLTAFRVSEYDASSSTKFMISMLFGKLAFTPEVQAHLGVPLRSLEPREGVYRSGYGGVSVPTCVKCPTPALHIPEVDVQGLLRANPEGAIVSLKFVVTADGHTLNITVLKPVGFGIDEQFAKAAVNWEFKPAMNPENKPVPVDYMFQASFKFK